MDQLGKRLARANVVGLDTPLFIYFLENNTRYGELARVTIGGIEKGRWQGITSTITLMEITVRPWQLGREAVAREYEAVLVHFPNLSIVDIDRDIARAAAQLRAKYNIAPPDALQVAASLSFGARAFLTNDKRLVKLQELMDVLVLDDFVEEQK
jgi:predicted nucleic acid-binding protein